VNGEAAFGNATLSPVIVAGETSRTVGALRPPRAHLSRRNDLLLVAAVAAYAILQDAKLGSFALASRLMPLGQLRGQPAPGSPRAPAVT
jgi:hypothetical protein